MSGIGKPNSAKPEKDNSIEGLEIEFQKTTDKIRSLLSGKKDKSQLGSEEKRELRTEYFCAASIAKKLSERCTEEGKAEKYKDFYKKLTEKAESYGSTVKRLKSDIMLDDVKGLENVKELVRTFLYMAQNPQVLAHYKIKGGLGLMMYGAPGTGKTMIAEAIANEMQMPLFVVTPADIFKSYVGESEAAVKQIFQELDMCEDGAILFVDECESIFTKRTSDAKDYKAAVTTELLQRLNGFNVDGSKRILIGATNRPDMIDPAFLRYKRFSHLVHVTPPDAVAKRAIIENKLSGISLDGVGVDDVLYMTTKFSSKIDPVTGMEVCEAYYSSADLCGIIEEACRIALEKLVQLKSNVPIPLTREMFEKAFSKIPPSISAELLSEYENFRKGMSD